MLEMHQTMRIPSDHILRLSVPNVPKDEEVEVFVISNNGSTDNAAKFALIARAANDPLYLSDMEEIANDFAFVDSEHI
jgi:hypothetical protein